MLTLGLALVAPLCPAQYQPMASPYPMQPQAYAYPGYGYPAQRPMAPMQYPQQMAYPQAMPGGQPMQMYASRPPYYGYPQPQPQPMPYQYPQAYPPANYYPPQHQAFSMSQATPGPFQVHAANLGQTSVQTKSPADLPINAEASEDSVVAGPKTNLPNGSEPMNFQQRMQNTRKSWVRSLWSSTAGRLSSDDSRKK